MDVSTVAVGQVMGGAVMSIPLDSPNPLASAVLAVLKAARELDFEITRAKLLYLADLEAVESGGTQFSGATWRWDTHGPYDHALIRAEDWLVDSEILERHDDRSGDLGSCVLSLTVELGDPLDAVDMRCVLNVLRLHGARNANDLKDISHATAPMIEALAGGERGVLLDFNRARRHTQTTCSLNGSDRAATPCPRNGRTRASVRCSERSSSTPETLCNGPTRRYLVISEGIHPVPCSPALRVVGA
jgi:hypothetical protein